MTYILYKIISRRLTVLRFKYLGCERIILFVQTTSTQCSPSVKTLSWGQNNKL